MQKIFQFKVSRSSLKFKNVTIVRYILDKNHELNDFYISSKFKSRRKKATEPADSVMKISDADPTLTCLRLKVAEDYINGTKIKFELDLHGENSRLRGESAHSYTTDLSLDFDRTSAINVSFILNDAAAKVTYSGRPVIIVPDSSGKITMQTAKFNINLAGQKSEFSFRIKRKTVDRQVLVVSQDLIAQLLRIPTIALYALIQPNK